MCFQRWTVNRQMSYEGGFQGRTNKLVDGCYSFWQGGAFPLIHMVLSMNGMWQVSISLQLMNHYFIIIFTSKYIPLYVDIFGVFLDIVVILFDLKLKCS